MAANPYKTMAHAKVSDNFTINSNQFIYVTKTELQEHESMETSEFDQQEEQIYFEGNSEAKPSEEDDFDPDINSLIRIKQEWAEPAGPRGLKQEQELNYELETPTAEEEETVEEEEFEWEDSEEPEERIKAEVSQPSEEQEPDEQDHESDEETIATFLTASGKQLALYAVEDSDDVFAVAAYDGSGKSPNQFQFLLKADVERLIGQGAVKTIKKPSSIKQQTYLGNTTTILRNNRVLKEETHEVPSPTYELHQPDYLQESNDRNMKEEQDDDLSYQLMESHSSSFEVTDRASMDSACSISSKSESTSKSPGGVVTAENLLFHEEESESELTFDDIKSIDFNVSDKLNSQKTVKSSFIKPEPSMEISNSKSSSMEVKFNSSSMEMEIGSSDGTKTVSMKSNYTMDLESGSSIRTNSMDTLKSMSDLMDTRSNSLKSISSRMLSSELSNSGNRSSFMEIEPNSMDDSMDLADNSFVEDSLMDVDNSLVRSNSGPKTVDSISGFNKSRSILRRTYQIVKSQDKEVSQLLGISPASISPLSSPDKEKTKQTKRAKHMPRALLGCKTNTFDSTASTVIIHGSTALICCPIQAVKKTKDRETQGSEENSGGKIEVVINEEKDKTVCKLKRPPRKQQLKINDRADSEIIIQPAVIEETVEEEAPPVRKRGRRKKNRDGKRLEEDEKKGKEGRSRRGRKKKSRIEVIELDEDDSVVRHIEEITIDEAKEKGSSDKENEIIMLESEDDTAEEEEEEEEEEDDEPWKCKFCRRSFKLKRAMDTHARVCPKSPRRLDKAGKEVKEKKYVCKICKETFDVVVALARHTRMHYKKTVVEKYVEPEKPEEEEEEEEEEIVEELEMLVEEEVEEEKEKETQGEEKVREVKKRKRVGSLHKKLRCMECRKWFHSMALLTRHYLNHDTKNTDRQMKYCYVCRKLIENKAQYLRHMQLHMTSPKKLSKEKNPNLTAKSNSKLNSHKETSQVQSKKTKTKSPIRRSTRSSKNSASTPMPASSISKRENKKPLEKKINRKKLSVRKSDRQKKL